MCSVFMQLLAKRSAVCLSDCLLKDIDDCLLRDIWFVQVTACWEACVTVY